ncbi:MAG: hypothetical protein AB8C84_09905 [Oligoflexales bacterium]
MLSLIKFHRYLSWLAGFWMLWMIISGLFLQHKKYYFSMVYHIESLQMDFMTADKTVKNPFLLKMENKRRVEMPRDEQPFWVVRELNGDVSCFRSHSYEKLSSTPYVFYRRIRSLHQKLNLGDYGKRVQILFVLLSLLLIGSGIWSGVGNSFSSRHAKAGIMICIPFLWVIFTGTAFFIKDIEMIQSMMQRKKVETQNFPKNISRVDYKKSSIHFRYRKNSDPHPIGSGRGSVEGEVIYLETLDDSFLSSLSNRLMHFHTGWGSSLFFMYRILMFMTMCCLVFLLKKIFQRINFFNSI